MFEYHGNNLTVDADGVSVTVTLAEPLDIEKPLADLDLRDAEVKHAQQSIADEDDMDGLRSDFEENDDWEEWDNRVWTNTMREGFHANGWAVGFVDNDGPSTYYPGEGGEEVLARAVPFLEIGVRGLLAFCSQQGQTLREWREQSRTRGEELTKAHWETVKTAAKNAAEELERVMPKRRCIIAFKELRQFIDEHGLEPLAHRATFWKEVEGKRLELYNPGESIGFLDEDFSGWQSLHLSQDTPPEKYNGHIGEVRVSKRGYFTAGKNTSLGLLFDGKARGGHDYLTVEEALESLIPYILEGEEDSTFGLNTAPGLPLPPEDDSDLEE